MKQKQPQTKNKQRNQMKSIRILEYRRLTDNAVTESRLDK